MNKTIVFISLFFAICTSIQGNIVSNQSLWIKLEQSGEIPQPIWGGSSAFDERRDLFYIFGGFNGTYPSDYPSPNFAVLNVKTLVWTNLIGDDTPVPRAESMFWVEPCSGNVYLTGGHGPFRRGKDLTFNTTNVYNIGTRRWSQVSQSIDQQYAANRSAEAKIIGNRAYAFSGIRSTLPGFINRPNALQTNIIVFDSRTGWQNVTVRNSHPTPRGHQCLGYAKDKNAIYTYGGYTNDPLNKTTIGERNYLSDLQEFNLNTCLWREIYPASDITPGKRDNAKIAYVDRKVLFLVGGSRWTGENFNDLWKFDFKTQLWTELKIAAILEKNNKAINHPITFGPFYFTKEDESGNHEFWMFAGSSSELGGILENSLYKLIISNKA